MTLENLRDIFKQGKDLGTVKSIYFEGGEPFLYYAVLLKGVREAAAMRFRVGIVSNGYWATDETDALECLKPFAGLLQDLSISSDLYHCTEKLSQQAQNASIAAGKLDIPSCVFTITRPEEMDGAYVGKKLPRGEYNVYYRGRAAEKLVDRATPRPWDRFTECSTENLREPSRVHVDPFGNLHICQGISIGNLFRVPLKQICETYDPDAHPIVGPLLAGGPVELMRRHGLPHKTSYADACHMCYEARRALRNRFPEILGPGQMYGGTQEAEKVA
jgi:MoaA/NifB/PqqE/SkfB family radical SAM enzyme